MIFGAQSNMKCVGMIKQVRIKICIMEQVFLKVVLKIKLIIEYVVRYIRSKKDECSKLIKISLKN